jgi:outer membrane immunogenic protein
MLKFSSGVLGSALVGAAALGLAASANADGMPGGSYGRAPFSWTGIYVGGNIGGGWGTTDWKFVDTVPPGNTSIPAGFPEASHDVSGWLGGGQIGANWQTGHLVLGVELMWDAADLTGDHHTPTFGNLLTSKVDSLGLLTGRVGYAWDTVLLYGKGGFAWTRDKYGRGFGVPVGGFPAGTIFAEANETRLGGTIGAGLEYAFARNWSAAVEYDHVFLGTDTVFFHNNSVANSLGFTPFNERIREDLDLLTVRLNYKFGADCCAAPLK